MTVSGSRSFSESREDKHANEVVSVEDTLEVNSVKRCTTLRQPPILRKKPYAIGANTKTSDRELLIGMAVQDNSIA